MNRIARLPFAVVCELAVAGCLSLALGVIAIAGELPYRPARYAGGFDPMRAGLAGMFAAAVLVFALFALAEIAAWRSGARVGAPSSAFSWVGLAITSASFQALIVTMPPVNKIDLPAPIGIPFFIGVGFLGAGLIPAIGAALRDAIRRRDRGLLAALVMVGALIVLRIVTAP
jgi:hypothetical protein